MNETVYTKEQSIKILNNLFQIAAKKQLVEKSLLENTRTQILTPMQKMDWNERAHYFKGLITILETTSNQEEIIKKAEALRAN